MAEWHGHPGAPGFCAAMHGGNLHVHPEQGGHATHRVDAKS